MAGKKEWFESWFHSPYYELLYYKRDRSEAKHFIDCLMDYLKPADHASFLDLACGSGRHSVYLASKGFEVTGVDLSNELIEHARKHESANLSFYVHDMRNLFRVNYYDYTLNLFTSFGYFENDRDNLRVLKNVFKGLKPNGTFVLDFFNAEKVISTLVKNETKTMKGVQFEITREVQNGFILKKIKITDGGKTKEFIERVRAFSKEELEKLFTESGFNMKARFGSHDLLPFANDSDRLIMIAEKTHA